MRKKWFSLVIVFLSLFQIYGSVSAAAQEQAYRFIFVCPIQNNEYWQDCMDGMRKADEELGTVTKVVGPMESDHFAENMIGYMEQAVAEHPDGIMLYAGIEELFPLIDGAKAQGIPVLAIDSDAPDTLRDAYVGTDAYNAGYKAGEKMVELTGGTARIGMLVSSESAEKEMKVVSVFSDAIQDYDMEIVAVEETDADPVVAEEKTRSMLAEHPEITALFNTAGYNVTGAARVKEAMGLHDLVLIGFDDVPENIQFVKKGVIDAIIVQQPWQMGYQAVYRMKECVEKRGLSKDKYDTGIILVTKDNVDSYSDAENISAVDSKTVRVGYYNADPRFQDGYRDDSRKSGYAYEYLQAISTVTGWTYDYVYGTREEILDKLLLGEVDLAAGVYRTEKYEGRLLFSKHDMGLDDKARYFAVHAQREDLLSELDSAMNEIAYASPGFPVNLWQRYYSHTAERVLTAREKEWLKNKGMLRLGYVRYNLPLCDQDEDGNPIGLIKDLTDFLAGYLQLAIQPVCYENLSDAEAALSRQEIDVLFPFYSDLWLTEQKGFRQTDALISDRAMIVYRGKYTDDLIQRVALSKTGIGQQNYMETYYPDSEITFYDNRKDTFSAIQREEERCIIGCSSVLQRFLREHSEFQNLNIAYLDTSENFGMAVHQENSLLSGILNKAIWEMGSADILSTLIQYSDVEQTFTFSDFVRRYSMQFIGFLSAIFIVLLCVFISYGRRARRFNREQMESNASLERALNAAELASEAKTQFLSSMSHDIRTPMNAVIGMTEIAFRHLDDREKVKECLEKISISGHHLITLINDVLDISKIESGKLMLNPVNFSIGQTMSDLIEIINPKIEEKRQEFVVHMEKPQWDTLYADEVRVNQIFINILSNAVKYTPEGGTIKLSFSEELLPGNDRVRLHYIVEDTGIGMSEEFMDKMYDLFSRARDSRTNKIQGTGIGLSIVKQMVDMMNGTIRCESEEGKGTKFTIVLDLPLGQEPEQSADDDSAAEGLNNLHLLIAEDNDLNWEVVSELLGLYDITAKRAENGQVCVDMLNAAPDGTYDLILMDIQMPVMNGKEAAIHIREHGREGVRNIPIIAMTADAFAEDIVSCMNAGMDGHTAKPIDIDNLFQEIRKVLDK